jgi:hypothetical protein
VEGSLDAEMNLRVPQNAGKFLSGCTIGNFSRRAQFHERVSRGRSSKLAQEVILLSFILAVPGLNLGWDVGYPE